jgi:hypothetical protein
MSARLDTEPQLPACHLCGSTTGPWLPDPEAERWPSGAQRLICSRRCNGEATAVEPDDDVLVLPADPDQPVPYTVTRNTSGWHRPDVETAALTYLTSVVGPVSARQLVDGLLARDCIENAAAKGTRTAGEPTLSSDVLAFLTAVRDALTLPFPDITAPGGYDEMSRLVSRRATAVRSAAAVAVRMGTPSWSVLTESVRDATESIPVTYAVRQDTALDEDAAKDACGYCRRPFDPTDTRWDGRARHGDTPWCRACVDRCHDTEIADHRCPVCARGDR